MKNVFLFHFLDVQRQGSSNDDFTGRNGHLSSKSYNDRSGYNGGKWYNEKRGNNRRSDELRSKTDFNYLEQSGGRGGTSNSKPRTERDVVSADRESNSSVENNNSRRRPKAKNTHNQTNSGKQNGEICVCVLFKCVNNCLLFCSGNNKWCVSDRIKAQSI